MKVLVTGGAGFIGNSVARHIINNTQHNVVVVDKLTYAGNMESLDDVVRHPRFAFELADICDSIRLDKIFETHKPDVVMHLAAESHVDRSIDGPLEFIRTNVLGTGTLLEAARRHLEQGAGSLGAAAFRFHHVSTDEVYGDLDDGNGLFTESTPYFPSSPYSASKAGSDHLVRAWCRTYDFPVVITNCSNNYGPFQFPEKLIPLIILNALEGKPLPIYGDGTQIRDWLYVEDHVRALLEVAMHGRVGETYNIGGHNEMRNIDVVREITGLLDELLPVSRRAEADSLPSSIASYSDLITFVKDRPGHDKRYAIDATKIDEELGWVPEETFQSGLRKTVSWYLDNMDWCRHVQDGSYQRTRLGTDNGRTR